MIQRLRGGRGLSRSGAHIAWNCSRIDRLDLIEFAGSARCRSDDEEQRREQELEPLDRGPYFDVAASHNVTALVGKTATLNCRVHNLGDRTVRIQRGCPGRAANLFTLSL